MNSDSYKYFAFISYSRKDSAAAKWLQRHLEWFRFPVKLVPEEARPGHPKYVRPVYRDKTNLEIDDSHYWENIQGAIEQSRFLIVLCSPDSASSGPVDKEVLHFLEDPQRSDPLSHVAPVILRGNVGSRDDSECLCPALLRQGDRLSDRNLPTMVPDAGESEKTGWENGFVAVASYLLRIDRAALSDHCKREERKRARRRGIWVAVFAVLAVMAVVGGVIAWLQRIEANNNYGLALLEKAETAEREKDLNSARLYALHALENLKDSEKNDRLRARNIDVNNPIFPVIFRTPNRADHLGAVTTVAFSPDGEILASGSADETVVLWHVASGEPKKTLKSHTNGVTSVAFSPDGKIFASGSHDRLVILWDIASGRPINTLKGHTNSVTSVAFSPDGKTLASGSADRSVILWETTTGKPRRRLKGQHAKMVRSIAFSPDGKTLASGSMDKAIVLWDTSTGEPRKTLGDHHTGGIESVAFSPDGKVLASGSTDTTVILWEIATGITRKVLSEHKHHVMAVAFSPDGKTLTSSSKDTTIILWNVSSGKPKETLKGHSLCVRTVAFNPKGNLLATGSEDNLVLLWDLATGKPKKTPNGHSEGVNCVAFSPDGKTLASSSFDRTIILWDLATCNLRAKLKGPGSDTVAFSPDGKILASGSWDGTIILWDVETGDRKTTIESHGKKVKSIAFSPDGNALAASSEDDVVMLFDVVAGNNTATLKYPGPIKDGVPLFSGPGRVAYSPDGKTLAVGLWGLWNVENGTWKTTRKTQMGPSVVFSPDSGSRILASRSHEGTVMLWDIATGSSNKSIEADVNRMSSGGSLAFSPDGKILATGSDRIIKLWDVLSGDLKATLKGHSEEVLTVAFSPDGMTLASGSWDNTVILWDLTNSANTSLKMHTGSIHSVAFSPDGKTLAAGSSGETGSFDNTLILWDVATGDWKASLRGKISNAFKSVAFSPDGKTLASGSSFDGTVTFWDLVAGIPKKVIEVHKKMVKGQTGSVNSVAFTSDGETLATGLDDGFVTLWDVATGNPKGSLIEHKENEPPEDSPSLYENYNSNSVAGVAFSPDDKMIASCSADETTVVWDAATGDPLMSFRGDEDFTGVAFSPDGKTLASGSWDKTVLVWDLSTKDRKKILKGHKEGVRSVAFSPDGRALASGSGDNTAILWDLATGDQRAVLKGHTKPVESVAFSPDGKILATGSEDNMVVLWDVLPDSQNFPARISVSEARTRLCLRGVALLPDPSFWRPNLYGPVESPTPNWSEKNPFHWISRAEGGDIQAMLQLGLIYDCSNDFEKAEEWYRRAAYADEKEAEGRLKLLAQRLWKELPEDVEQDNYDRTLVLCRKVIALDPNFVDAYWLRGQIMDQRGEQLEAERDYRKVCDLDPNFADAFGNLAWVLISQGRWKEAEPFCLQAHKLDPKNFDWALILGHLYLFKDEVEKAYALYDTAVDQIQDHKAFEDGPAADFEFFIRQGWHVEKCKQALARLRAEFEKRHVE